ncbi:MAG: hypothetical protein RMK31_08335 [Candidatus Caldarchaeum sp.]|nr:hypothetical protein [Candidatus Caldarchaeum sp.]
MEVVPTGAKTLSAVMISTATASNHVGGAAVELLKTPIWGDTCWDRLSQVFFTTS